MHFFLRWILFKIIFLESLDLKLVRSRNPEQIILNTNSKKKIIWNILENKWNIKIRQKLRIFSKIEGKKQNVK